MDKYTVDLDKVLNDFEYSELTDNFSSSRTYLAQGGSSYASSSKSKTGETKHSITNVFHSLNEYLNTDISVKPTVIVDNKESTSEVQNVIHPPSERFNLKIFDQEDTDALVISLDEKHAITEPTVFAVVPNVLENVSLVCEDVETVIIDDADKDNNEALSAKDHIEKPPENLIDEVNDSNIQNNIEPCDPESSSDDDGSYIKEEIFFEIRDTNVPKCKDEASVKNTQEPTLEIKEFLDSNDHLAENETADKMKELLVATDEVEEVKPDDKVISFNDTNEIDDSLLNKYLDELEHELESPTLENVAARNVTALAEEDLRNVEDDQCEQSVLPENKINEVVISNDKNGLIKEAQIVEDEQESETSTLSVVRVLEISEADESLERPTLLNLTSQSLEEQNKRKINLIGEPGSTPYNNFYVSKELQMTVDKAGVPENLSENSSVSPTFSEASTDTVSDSSDSEVDQQTDNAVLVREISDNDDAVAVGSDTQAEDEVINAVAAAMPELSPQPVTSAVSPDIEQDGGFWLGRQAPMWIPDSEALSCLHCDAKFTVIKRRHHCRACGLVLCSKCCNMKYRLDYLDAEARVCSKCFNMLSRDPNSVSGRQALFLVQNYPGRQPNPNNPMEYCSVVPPLQQVSNVNHNPPTVMVPVGVLKRKGSNKAKSTKSVMFCDGIRPGSDLTSLDTDFDYAAKNSSSSSSTTDTTSKPAPKGKGDMPTLNPDTKSFFSKDVKKLPPVVTVFKSEVTNTSHNYFNNEKLVGVLKSEKLTFALHKNVYVHVKIIDMSCCINKKAWCFSTEGLLSVGQDEIVYLIECIEDEASLPIDIFHHLDIIYNDALKGTSITELGLSLHDSSNFLGFKNHAGFLYIRPSFQCLQNIIKPAEPFLIGLLIHRWETPWAKIFPIRLVLRLGAEYRYYPSPVISTRHRDSVFVEIGHTIINLLADFRNFSYTLPSIRGLAIHMEEKNTTVTIPANRYDQVMKSLNNSSDHILALGGNFSTLADSHLVCIQDTQSTNENSYTTHAINIHNKPRKVTGASFIVFNGALKSTSGLTAKSSIVEDGLMIQIPAKDMVNLRESLRNMKNYTVQCGCVNTPSDETVNIVWGGADNNFNIGVTSPIDNQSLSGVPSIRVHNGKDFLCNSGKRLIRWTEVFILQNTEEHSKARDPLDVSKISESISKATCQALVKYLDLLSSNNFLKIGIRTSLHVENVSYYAGSNNIKLPPIYMKSLDNELVPVLHAITTNNTGDNDAVTLELIFRILNT